MKMKWNQNLIQFNSSNLILIQFYMLLKWKWPIKKVNLTSLPTFIDMVLLPLPCRVKKTNAPISSVSSFQYLFFGQLSVILLVWQITTLFWIFTFQISSMFTCFCLVPIRSFHRESSQNANLHPSIWWNSGTAAIRMNEVTTLNSFYWHLKSFEE